MSGAIKINGTSSGSTTITAPASGGDESIELSTALAAKLDSADYKPGLSLITTQTFSAVSSVSINNCFSATYDNYRIVIRATGTATTPVVFWGRLRASGADLTGSVYYYGGTYVTSAGGPARDYTNSTGFLIGYIGDYRASASADLFDPFASQNTGLASQYAGPGTSLAVYGVNAGWVNNTSTYDGITIYPNTSTMTGSVSVYGYQK